MRKPAAIGIALATLLVLAGCVGIPTSGSVQTGPVIDDQADPEVVVLPAGPQKGADPSSILAGFMQAVRGPQNDYATARQFLTKDLAENWDPDASTLIRTSPGSLNTIAENTIDYSFTSRSSVDADGRYSEQDAATQTLEFRFVQVAGEWRISEAPNGIVLSQSSFNIVFTERALYFFDPSHSYLVPDVRWFPSRATVPVRIVSALLAGPASWLGQGVLTTAFPVATALDTGAGSVQLRAGAATVDLSKEALAATPQDRALMRQQLSATLGVSTVEMTVGGVELDAPDSSAAIINPGVDPALLLGTGTAIGFDSDSSDSGVTSLPGLSAKLLSVGASSIALSNDKQSAVALGATGAAYFVRNGNEQPVVVDSRGGLVVPTLDPFLFVWSAQASSAASLSTFGADGAEHSIQSGLPADARVVSLDVSRDGTRVLVYLSTDVGPRLFVAGVIRGDGNVPTALGELLPLAAPSGTPIDAAWVDERSVATLSQDTGAASVTEFEVGGPSASLGQIPDGVSMVGGSNGADGLRVLRTTGDAYRPAGSGGWVDTGIAATFLGTKQ